MTHGVPLETVISKIISSATQNLLIFNALFQYIHIFKPTEEIRLCSLKPSQLLSKMDLVPLFLCKSMWCAFTPAQENVPATLMTQREKESSGTTKVFLHFFLHSCVKTSP